MSIIQQLLEWSEVLPAWQSDALRRLISQPELTPKDFDDVLAILKSTFGIADPQGRLPLKLNSGHVPALVAPSAKIELLAIKNLERVNAIAPNNSLPISPSGLTVIYGDNGSGKSGYARVLKRACRARDRREPIHPNAALQPSEVSPAQATFEITANGVPEALTWTDGQPGPDLLSSVAIFDSRCADAYLEDEDDFSYVPHGLEILKRLGRLCEELRERFGFRARQDGR